MTDYATVPHYFLPPEDDPLGVCDAPGCAEVPLDPIHTEPDGTYSGVPDALSAEFADVG